MEIKLQAIRHQGIQGIQFTCISPKNDFAIGLKKEQEKNPKLCVFSLKKDYSINSEILIEELTRGIPNGFNIEAIFHPYFDPPIFVINGSIFTPYSTKIYQLNPEKTGVIHLDTTYANSGKILFHQTLPIISIHNDFSNQINILRMNDENKLSDLYCKFKRGCYRGFSKITFHPSEPVIVTGSGDGDHLIKIWRFNEDYTRTECIEILQHPIEQDYSKNNFRPKQIIFHTKSEIMATIGQKIIKIWKLNFGGKSECLYTKITDDESIENCIFHPTKPIILVKCSSGDHSRGIPYKYFINIFSISPIGELEIIGVIHEKFSAIKFNNDGNCLIVDESFEKAQEGYNSHLKTIFASTSFYDFSKIMPIVVEKPEVVKEEAKKVPPPDYLIDSAFSCEIMEDPVIASDGITYNRSEIEEWFKKHDTSPKTGEILKSKNLIPNISIRNAIEEWKKSNPQ
jgi:WD40 repeat protein